MGNYSEMKDLQIPAAFETVLRKMEFVSLNINPESTKPVHEVHVILCFILILQWTMLIDICQLILYLLMRQVVLRNPNWCDVRIWTVVI